MTETTSEPSEQDFAVVHLLQVPVPLWKASSIHIDAVNRELEIVRSNSTEDDTPSRFHALVTELEGRFGDFGGPNRAILEAAAERGESHVDLRYELPKEAADAARRLGDMLDLVDHFCEERDELLSLATPDDLVRFRNWFLDEFERQIVQDLPPRSWPEFEGTAGDGSEADIRFEGDLDIASADHLRQQLRRLRAGDASNPTVDLSGLTFVDSVGLSLLVMGHTSFEAEGKSLRILMPESLRSLIELSGLIDVLDIDFVPPRPPTGGTSSATQG